MAAMAEKQPGETGGGPPTWQLISDELDALLVRSATNSDASGSEGSARSLRSALMAIHARVETALQNHTAQHYPLLMTLHRTISNSHSVHFSVLEPKLRALQHAAATADAQLQQHSALLDTRLKEHSQVRRRRLLMEEMLREEAFLSSAEAFVRQWSPAPSSAASNSSEVAHPPLPALFRACDKFEAYLACRKRCSALASAAEPDASPLPLFIAQASRAKQVEASILSALDVELKGALARYQEAQQPASAEQVRTLFATYDRIGAAMHAQNYIMLPSKHLGIAWGQPKAYESISLWHAWVRRVIFPLVPLADNSGYHLPLHSIWRSLSELLTAGPLASSVFSSTDADLLLRNYRALCSLQADLSHHCSSEAQRESLLKDSVWVECERKWNWAVYFQLRSLELLPEPSSIFSLTEPVWSSSREGPFATRGAELVCGLLRHRLFSMDPETSGTFVYPLAHRFLKMALQLMARFQVSVVVQWNHSVAQAKPLESMLPLVSDAIAVTRCIEAPSATSHLQILAGICVADSEFAVVGSLMADALRFAATRLSQHVLSAVSDSSVDLMYRLCLTPGQGSQPSVLAAGVRALSSQYLLSSEKGMPTAASAYARALMSPLEAIRSSNAGKLVAEEIWVSWLSNLASRVLTHYSDVILQFAHSTSKRQEFLSRQKRGPTTSAPGVSAGSKMVAQLDLDVGVVCEQLRRLLGPAFAFTELDSYQSLVTQMRDLVPSLLSDVN